MNIQKRYSILLIVVVLLSALNANVGIQMRNNDGVNNKDKSKWTCAKRTARKITSWTCRVSSWGFCLSKNTCSVTEALLGGSSEYLYGVLNASTQQISGQQQKRSRLKKVGLITTKCLFKASVGSVCLASWAGKHTASLAKNSFAYLEKTAYHRYETYRDESQQQINVANAGNFGVTTFSNNKLKGTEVLV